MSRMKMDDIIFGRSLREPGYRVDFAVGSTYSLDIETFISLPFSLGFLEEPDEAMKKSLTYIFAALRLCSDRLAVFCNFADIKVPPTAYKVYCALMEGSVFPVDVSRKNRIVNFHPKVWVVRQTSIEKDDSILRVIVMSRNLTRDGSLDCACVLTGRIGDQQASEHARAKHKPLRDFLRFLAKNATGLKQADMIALAADVLRVERFDVDGPYDDYAFLPMGIRGYSGEADLDDLRRSVRVVVVSPFLDDETVRHFASAREERLLVTQEQSITQAAVDTFGKENVYTTSPGMTNNDLDESVNLHAKMYFSTRYDDGWRNYVYLGSTNATRNGFSSNVEFLVRMRFKKYIMSWYEFGMVVSMVMNRLFAMLTTRFRVDDGTSPPLHVHVANDAKAVHLRRYHRAPPRLRVTVRHVRSLAVHHLVTDVARLRGRWNHQQEPVGFVAARTVDTLGLLRVEIRLRPDSARDIVTVIVVDGHGLLAERVVIQQRHDSQRLHGYSPPYARSVHPALPPPDRPRMSLSSALK